LVPSGVGKGTPLRLREWQKQLIRDTFDSVDEHGNRKVRRALWSVARKNGKSALAAALLLCALVGPLSQMNGEVYSAATTRDQAAMVYKMAAQMVRLDPELSQLCACMDATKRIVCYHLGSFYQALSADAHTQHGANPHFVIYDELAQAKTRELYDVLATSFGAQANALLLVISTQSSDPQSVMSELCDDAIEQERGLLDDPTFFGRVFRVPDEADPWDERNWVLANPALGDFKVLADMRSQAEKAKRSPSNEAAFRNLQLNQRVDGAQAFVNSTDWRACDHEVTDEELAGVEAVGGLDLSGRRDLTALVLLFRLADGRVAVRAWHWTHAENLAERSILDAAQYVVWRDKGYLTVLGGRVIDYSQIAEHIKVILGRYKVKQLHFDRWRIHEFARALEAAGVSAAVKAPEKNQKLDLLLIEHGQGYKDMSPAIDSLEDLVLTHQLQHGGNPLLTYCIANVRLTRDPAGNRKFDKRQQNRRIDGAVAMAMAVSGLNKPAEIESIGPSVYETRGILVF
jgi:phage terminase large subunit-like protein